MAAADPDESTPYVGRRLAPGTAAAAAVAAGPPLVVLECPRWSMAQPCTQPRVAGALETLQERLERTSMVRWIGNWIGVYYYAANGVSSARPVNAAPDTVH